MMSAPHTWILGLGVTGLSVVRHLAQQANTFAVWDSRAAPAGADRLHQDYPHIALQTGPFDGVRLALAKRLVVSPGIDLRTPALQQAIAAGVEIIGDIELFARAADKPVIAITGSNGKTTVTSLVGHLAQQCGLSVGVGGNIGTPALDLLGQQHDLYVLELSSFQLETTRSLQAIAGTVLNVSPDHLDRYDSFAHYCDTKLSLYQQSQTVIFNRADLNTYVAQHHDVLPENRLSFGLDQAEERHFGVVNNTLMQGDTPLVHCDQLTLVGAHNQQNILAALALGQAAGLPLSGMLAALASFQGLAHRCELIGEHQGVRYINDSKATNVGATEAALAGLPLERVWLIAGGEGKGQDLTVLSPYLTQLAGLITLGKDGPALAALRSDSTEVDSLEQAVTFAAEQAKAGDLVLLSPACASLDMFSSYEQRGQIFADAVRGLA